MEAVTDDQDPVGDNTFSAEDVRRYCTDIGARVEVCDPTHVRLFHDNADGTTTLLAEGSPDWCVGIIDGLQYRQSQDRRRSEQ